MHNGLRGIPGEKIKDTSGLPETLIDKTTKFSESLEKVVTDDFLTEEETKFFDELQNPDAMKENAKKIVSELCKRICDGENPSQKLFDNVCLKLIGIEGGMYPGYTQALLKKLPDWKDIAYLFQYNSNNSYNAVEEFRKKRKEYMNSKLNPMHSSLDDPIRKELVNQGQSNGKTIEEYMPINSSGYYKKFPKFRLADDVETDIPLLTHEDVNLSGLSGGARCFTEGTKIPWFDARSFFYERSEDFSSDCGKKYCIYNPEDKISHVLVCGDDNDGRVSHGASFMISIKGKVSQQDARNLLEYLNKNTNLKFNPFSYCIENPKSINRLDIQRTIIDYFNSK